MQDAHFPLVSETHKYAHVFVFASNILQSTFVHLYLPLTANPYDDSLYFTYLANGPNLCIIYTMPESFVRYFRAIRSNLSILCIDSMNTVGVESHYRSVFYISLFLSFALSSNRHTGRCYELCIHIST